MLQSNLRDLGSIWHEWEKGINNSLPAKLWNEKQTSNNSKCSRRKPIYLSLDSLINHKGMLPSTAFKLVEKHFGKLKMGQLGDEIRRRISNGTLPEELVVRHYKLDLRKSAPGRKRPRTTVIETGMI